MKQEAANETKAINEKFGVKVNKKRNAIKIKTPKKGPISSETVDSDDDHDAREGSQTDAPATPQKESKKRKISNIDSSEDTTDEKRARKDKQNPKDNEFAAPAPVVTSTPHPKSAKKQNNTLTSDDTADEETKKPTNAMVQIPSFNVTNNQLGKTPEKKKKKKDKSPEKKLNKSIEDSEASTSSTASMSNKKKRKDKTSSDEVLPPGKRPPSTLLKYYATHVYNGKPNKVEKHFRRLTNKEKKALTAQHNDEIENYVAQLKTYLGSLSKEDALDYVSRSDSFHTNNLTATDVNIIQ